MSAHTPDRRMAVSRVLWVVAGLAALAWFTLGALASWVRPVALAALVGALALAYWRRAPARGAARASADPEPGRPAVEQSTKDLWDALDRGEDPTFAPVDGGAPKQRRLPARASASGQKRPR